MKPIFNYDKINETHKEAVQEVVEFLSATGNTLIADVISKRFKLVEPVRYDLKQCEIFKKFEDFSIPYNIQGYSKENDVEYQIINVMADVRKWEEFWKYINENNKV